MLNKKIVAAGVALLLAQASSFAADSVFGADSVSGEFATGNKTKMARAGLQWNWDKQWFKSNGTHLGGYWDATVAQWQGDAYQGVSGSKQNITDLGFTPVFRFEADNKKGFYSEAAIGFHLFSQVYDNNGRKFSTAFQFGDHIGVGYVFDGGWDLGFKVQHFSNGAIKKPNPGVNFAVLKLAHSF
ncbi:MAG: acyloxyacyl hydrolase [Pseudomonadota bacterium]